MNDVERAIGRLEGKMDTVLEHLEKMNGSVAEHIKDDEVRFASIEQGLAVRRGQERLLMVLFGVVGGLGQNIIYRWLRGQL